MHRLTLIPALCLVGCAGAAFADDAVPANIVPGEVLVHFAGQPEARDLAAVEAAMAVAVEWDRAQHAPHARGRPDLPHPLSAVRIARVDAGADVVALAAAAGGVEGVLWASPNRIPELAGDPDDPQWPDQWGPARIEAARAWDTTQGSANVIVAIVDTGSRVTHEDLAENTWINSGEIPGNGVDDDGNGFVDDVYGWDFQRRTNDISDNYGHGAQVSGIVAARLNNATGVAGLGNVKVMAAKWWHTGGSDLSVAESVYYAVDNGAHVVNMSLSCGCDLPLTDAAVQYAYDNGVLCVAAAGNAGSASPHDPASHPTVVAVSAIDRFDRKPSFSSYGAHIDVAGPSPEITTTAHWGDQAYGSTFGGTSAASPHVAGVAALILSVNPTLSPDEVRQILRDTATDVGDPGFDNFFGYGRVNAADAVEAAAGGCVADIDGDGDADVDDFFAYLDLFAAGDARADINGDGVVDVDDFFGFLDAFAAGC